MLAKRSMKRFHKGISKLTSSLADLARLTIFDNLTANLAASSKLSHANILRPDAAISTFASSTFVPCWTRKIIS